MKDKTNPFVITGYQGAKYFCDREDETATVIEAIQSNRPLVMYAPRKMGKSGLIHHVFANRALKGFDTLYIDLFETQSIEGLLRSLSMNILQKFEKKQERMVRKFMEWFAALRPQVSLNPQNGMPEFGLSLGAAPEGFPPIHEIFKYLDDHKNPVVLALDEFQQIGTYGGHALEAELRKVFQSLKNTRLIISGSTQHLLVPMFTSPSRPLYQMTDYLHLGYLDAPIYGKFIQDHFKANEMDIPETVTGFILKWSWGHTYYTQLICNKLYATGKPKIEIGDVLAVIQSMFIEREMIFQQIRNTLPTQQFKLLQAIAKAGQVEQITSAEFLNRFSLGAHSTVRKSIDVLCKEEYVLEEHSDGKAVYRVYDVILGRWLEKTYSQNF